MNTFLKDSTIHNEISKKSSKMKNKNSLSIDNI